MTDILSLPLDAFHHDLQRLENLVSFLELLREFGSSIPLEEATPSPFILDACALRDSIRSRSADFPILSGTLLLFLAGRFEHFVRTVLQGYSDSIAAKCAKYDQLPEKIRNALTTATLEVVAKPKKHGFTEVQARGMVQDLSRAMAAEEGLGNINSSILTSTESNMRPGVLADLCTSLGIDSVWASISKESRLKMHFETNSESSALAAAKAELENLMEVRNGIAHPSDNPSFPDPDQVRQYLRFLRVLSQVFADVCRVHMAAFKVPP